MIPLFECILEQVPPPGIDEGPFQMLVSNLDYNSYKGKLAIGRIYRGSIKPHDKVTVLAGDNAKQNLRDQRGIYLHGTQPSRTWKSPAPGISWL